MSDKKREIHVKDLVIKADNVIFETPKRPVHPFFGPPRRLEGIEDEQKFEADVEESSSSSSSSSSDDKKDQRRPFSWI